MAATKKKTPAKKEKFPETVFIVNPKSAAGKTEKRWHDTENVVLKNIEDFRVLFTERQGHGTELARAAIRGGAKKIVAVGGDGTISEVAQGFFDEKGKPIKAASSSSPMLGIVAAGTGSDLVRTLGLPREIDEAIRVVAGNKTRTLDMGYVTFVNKSGKKEGRPFINISEMGLGGVVVEILEKQGKGGGWLSYQLASFRGLMQHEAQQMTISLDKNIKREGKFKAVVIANGRYFGSGMKIAPHAEPDDGLFDIVLVGDLNKLEMMLKMSKVQSGKHIYEEGIEVARAKSVSIQSMVETKLESDGEPIGYCPAEYKIVPKAIRVLVDQ